MSAKQIDPRILLALDPLPSLKIIDSLENSLKLKEMHSEEASIIEEKNLDAKKSEKRKENRDSEISKPKEITVVEKLVSEVDKTKAKKKFVAANPFPKTAKKFDNSNKKPWSRGILSKSEQLSNSFSNINNNL